MAERDLTIRLRADGRGLTATVNQGTRQFQLFGRQLDMTRAKTAALATQSGQLTGALGALRTLLPAMGFALLIRHGIQAAEQFRSIDARVRRATEALGDYNQVSRELYSISQGNGTVLAETANLFINIARAAEDLGRSRRDVLQLTDTIQQLGVISGASDTAMQNSLRQFSQAMAGGIVRAEEFNSIIENTPEIAVAIARGLGMSVGQLRLAVIEGRVLADDVFESVLKQSERVAKEAANMPLTISRSWNMMTNSLGRYIAMANESSGLTETLATTIQRASQALDEMIASGDTQSLEVLATVLGTIAENFDLIAVAVGGILAKNLFMAVAAQLIAVATAGTAARGALLLLGGPAGIAAIASVGIYSLVSAIRDHKSAAEQAVIAQGEYNDIVKQGGDIAISAAEKRLADLQTKIAELPNFSEVMRIEQGVRSAHGAGQASQVAEHLRTLLDQLETVRGHLAALKQGLSAVVETTDESFGKFYSAFTDGVTEAQIKAAEAKKTLDDQLQVMREQGRVAQLSARQLAAYNAVQDAMKAGVTEGVDQIHTLALRLYDEGKAREQTKKRTEEQTEAIRQAAAARRDELNAMAEAEAIAWDFDRAEQFERDRTIAHNQALQERVDNIVQAQETETETAMREYDRQVAALDEAYNTDGVTIIRGYNQARARIEQQYSEKIVDIHRREWEEKHKIASSFIDEASGGFARYITDQIRGEKEAKEAARDSLQERLDDLQERLDEGTISVQDANKARRELYEDFYDRLNEIEKEAADRLKDTLVGAFVSAIEEMLKEWIKRGMTRLAIGLTDSQPGIFSSGGGGNNVLGSIARGIGGGGGGGSAAWTGAGGARMGIGSLIGGNMGANIAFGTSTNAIPGAVGSFKAPAAFASQASSGAAGASGGGAASSGGGGMGGFGGAAVIAIAAIGASIMEKGQQRMIKAAIEEMNANFSPADMQPIGLDSTWIGSLKTAQEGVESMWLAVDGKLVTALEEVEAISGGIGLRFSENGEMVHKLTGDVGQVRAALEGAKISGYGFAGSIETAIEKGNGLQVSITGNAKHIKSALEEAVQGGVGAFSELKSEGGVTTARLTGDIGQWDKVLQGFVTGSVASAISGVSAIGNAASGAAGQFLSMAAAARSAASASGGLGGGGRSNQVTNVSESAARSSYGLGGQVDGSHADGLSFVPFDGYRPLLHRGERVLTARENALYSRLVAGNDAAFPAGRGGASRRPPTPGGDDPSLLEGMGGSDNSALLIEIRNFTRRTAEAYEGMLREQQAAGRGGR